MGHAETSAAKLEEQSAPQERKASAECCLRRAQVVIESDLKSSHSLAGWLFGTALCTRKLVINQ